MLKKMEKHLDEYEWASGSERDWKLATPFAVLYTDEIVAEWKRGWQEDPCSEDWKLECYPVLPDGTLLVAFSMACEVYGGAAEVEHTMMYYRVIHFRYDEEERYMKPINRYRFKAQDARLLSMNVRMGVFYAVLQNTWNGESSVLQLFPNEDDWQYSLGRNVNRVLFLERFGPVVAYRVNMDDYDVLPLLTLCNESGEVCTAWSDPDAIECRAIALDSDECAWAHFYPSGEVVEFNHAEHPRATHAVSLPGFTDFGLSDDKSRLVACYTGKPNELKILVLHRQEDGSYRDPVRYEFHPESEPEVGMGIWDYDGFYGCPSICKSTMVLRAANSLHVFDLNEFQ